MASKLTHQQRGRRYLQASLKAGLTGLPKAHREAYEQQMREHERAYPNVREHALAGADQDFDKPLTAGEREHQQHLREQEGLQHAEVLRIRRDLREGNPMLTRRPTRRQPEAPRRRSRAALTTPLKAAQATVDPLKAAISSKGSLWLQIAGYILGLSLIYLLLTKQVSNSLAGIGKIVTGAANTFIAPVDPITSFENAIKAKAINGGGETGSVAASAIAAGALPAGTAAQAAGIEATKSTGSFDAAAVTPAAKAFDRAHGVKLPKPLERPQVIAGALRSAQAAALAGRAALSTPYLVATQGGI